MLFRNICYPRMNISALKSLIPKALVSCIVAHATFAMETVVPQIDLDAFEPSQMDYILKNCGSFELVGPRIEQLRPLAEQAFQLGKEILRLPLSSLEDVNEDPDTKEIDRTRHGFENFKKITRQNREKAKAAGQDPLSVPIQNQIVYHYNRYIEQQKSRMNLSKIPCYDDGTLLNISAIDAYDREGGKLLWDLYNKMADHFIKQENRTVSGEDSQFVITLRRYFKDKDGDVYINEHSDLLLLTLAISDQAGFEIKLGDAWIDAPYEPKFRFYVNIGDWLLFQTGSSDYCKGIHRVIDIPAERHFMGLFFGPLPYERLTMPDGTNQSWEEFVFGTNNKIGALEKFNGGFEEKTI